MSRFDFRALQGSREGVLCDGQCLKANGEHRVGHILKRYYIKLVKPSHFTGQAQGLIISDRPRRVSVAHLQGSIEFGDDALPAGGVQTVSTTRSMSCYVVSCTSWRVMACMSRYVMSWETVSRRCVRCSTV